jgi:predicted nicotinamide N-methyase
MSILPDYEVKFEMLSLDNVDFYIRSLKDRQQFSDPDREAEKMGISSAMWSLFGVVWPSALVLIKHMAHFDSEGKRVLEIGCGLGLASLVMHQRNVDITACDYHPMAASFLRKNVILNDLEPLPFLTGNWLTENPLLGKFDVIIGSDVLYEQAHPAVLSKFIDRHTNAHAEIKIVDPGRGHQGKFNRAMETLGYESTMEVSKLDDIQGSPYHGKIFTYQR